MASTPASRSSWRLNSWKVKGQRWFSWEERLTFGFRVSEPLDLGKDTAFWAAGEAVRGGLRGWGKVFRLAGELRPLFLTHP